MTSSFLRLGRGFGCRYLKDGIFCGGGEGFASRISSGRRAGRGVLADQEGGSWMGIL